MVIKAQEKVKIPNKSCLKAKQRKQQTREKIRKAKAQLELNLAAGVGKKGQETLLQIHQQKEEDQGESPFLTG